MKFRVFIVFVLFIGIVLPGISHAQNKVVVIPLMSDCPPPVLPPCANTYTNSIGMTFNLLPAGTFTMGSPATEPGGPYINETEHQVTLSKAFYMQTTEVTNGHWDAVIVDKGRGVNPSTSHTGDLYPVESINWYEAASFANWISYDEGRTPCYSGEGTCTGTLGDDFTCTTAVYVAGCDGYRLPTEAQWEYAARATTTTAWSYFYSYDTSADPGQVTDTGFNSNLDAMGWYYFNRTTQYPDGTKPVARKQGNKWGLFDMHGNVWEWCQDWYDDYPSGPVTDPQGPVTGSLRVIRGGSWNGSARVARSANRGNGAPGFRDFNLGFRLALPPGQ